MNIHEYQAKALLRGFGVPVPKGIAVVLGRRGRGSRASARRPGLGGEGPDPCRRPRQGPVQGDRRRRQGRRAPRPLGRRGGRRRRDRCSAGRWSPTRPDRPAARSSASISRKAPTSTRELYLSLLVDRATAASPSSPRQAGGMNIEEVAAETPEKIVTVHVDPAAGYVPHVGRAGRLRPRAQRRRRSANATGCSRRSTGRSSTRT